MNPKILIMIVGNILPDLRMKKQIETVLADPCRVVFDLTIDTLKHALEHLVAQLERLAFVVGLESLDGEPAGDHVAGNNDHQADTRHQEREYLA